MGSGQKDRPQGVGGSEACQQKIGASFGAVRMARPLKRENANEPEVRAGAGDEAADGGLGAEGGRKEWLNEASGERRNTRNAISSRV
jgi:hypothetical protein